MLVRRTRAVTDMDQIAVAFISTVLTVELIQLGFRPIDFPRIAIRHQGQIDNLQNSLEGVPHLMNGELPAVSAQGFVVNGEIHPGVVLPDK